MCITQDSVQLQIYPPNTRNFREIQVDFTFKNFKYHQSWSAMKFLGSETQGPSLLGSTPGHFHSQGHLLAYRMIVGALGFLLAFQTAGRRKQRRQWPFHFCLYPIGQNLIS